MKKLYRYHGFTLLELLITVAVLAILVSLAVPNMSDTAKRGAVKSTTRNYLGGLSFARNEAQSRGRTVKMCPSVDGANCDQVNFDWSNGFIIVVDKADGSGEEILLAHESSPTSVVDVSSSDPGSSTFAEMQSISWNYQGYVASDKRVKVVVCHRDLEQKYARGLYMERTGRVMSSRDSNGDGIHESTFDSGAALTNPPNLTCS